ncbi:MAG: FAD-dependent oxidoreductase [Xanthobacteraceae bacterium]
MSRDYDIAVIGGGMSGLVAAMQCAGRGATVVCINDSIVSGGLIGNIGKLDGFPTMMPTSGGALADSVIAECKALGVEFISAEVQALQPSDRQTVVILNAPVLQDARLAASVVIVATGARLRKLGIPGESELTGRGISQCDWCDGGFFRDQAVAVIGGGDASYQAALHLAGICRSVTIVMRSSEIRARRSYVQAAADNERIAFSWDTAVSRIIGTDCVEGLILNNLAERTEETLSVSGVFVFIGTEPNSAFLPPAVKRDAAGAVVTSSQYCTSLPGVYAIGAVRSGYSGQLLSACGEAATVAAIAVAEAELRASF